MTPEERQNDEHDECRYEIERLTARNKVLQAAVDAVEEWLLPLAAIRAAQEGKQGAKDTP